MNEETQKAMDALTGGSTPAGTQSTDTTDWKAMYEEAQRKLASAQVEQGRVKKLDEEKKELERQLAEARSTRSVQSAIDELPDELKTGTPEDYQKLAAIAAQRAADKAVQEAEERRKAELDTIRAQMAEREGREARARQAGFAARIEQEFPGFLKSAVTEGGDKHEAWVQYQRYNAASINAAAQACDFETLSWHIRKFYTDELGIAAPSGGSGAAAPDPSATGGGQRVHAETGKIYTAQEYAELEKKAMQLRRMGDFEGYRKLDAELNNILTEGRVKD